MTAPSSLVIHGEIISKTPVDTVTAVFWEHYVDSKKGITKTETIPVATEKGNVFSGTMGSRGFCIKTPSFSGMAYLSLRYPGGTLWKRFHITAGDTVRTIIDLDRAAMLFSGPDAESYRVQYQLAMEELLAKKRTVPVMFTANREAFLQNDGYDAAYKKAASLSKTGLYPLMRFVEGPEDKYELIKTLLPEGQVSVSENRLEEYRDKIPQLLHGVLRADLTAKRLNRLLDSFNRYMDGGEKYKSLYGERILPLTEIAFADEVVANSSDYTDLLLLRSLIISRMERKSPESLFENYAPPVRDYLTVKFMARYHRQFEDVNERFAQAEEKVQAEWIKHVLANMASSMNTGKPFLDVALEDIDGEEVHLNELRGKAVFIDFWFTGCKACVLYHENQMEPLMERFKNDDRVVFVSINTDQSKKVWKRSLESGKYTSQTALNLHLGDMGNKLLEYYRIQSFPVQMMLDSSGNVFRSGLQRKSVGDMSALLRKAKNPSW
ncbi:hypothetical protein GCM10011339_10280 [Echinicola rosea]|uniref:Thioredoxin domain-containing protein n=1 Tax=Echinicola rosea TaxID=1807691 RepID=A0ABQ1UQ71_9BACT|nr:hypothetical protein GCM10011339_10280 [Echinicola rosea]